MLIFNLNPLAYFLFSLQLAEIDSHHEDEVGEVDSRHGDESESDDDMSDSSTNGETCTNDLVIIIYFALLKAYF